MSKSMIAGLQSELAAKQKKVADYEAALAKVSKKAQEALDRAKEELAQYKAKIAEALGLPTLKNHSDRLRAAHARRRQVKELLGQGKGAEEIAAALGLPLVLIESDVEKLSAKGAATKAEAQGELQEDEAPQPPPRPHRELRQVGSTASKADRVFELVKAGKNAKQIAVELDNTIQAVYAHICALRKEGRLPPVGESRSAAADTTSPASAESAGDDDSEADDGPNLDTLRAEVQRQQAGQRGKGVNFATSEASGHTHRVITDRMGDGITQPDATGHQHRVYRFAMSRMAGHAHVLTVQKAAA
jgi:DNA-binding NarL/FixJ family response regulator